MASRKIVSVFDTREAAQNACNSLLELGLDRDQMSIMDPGASELATQSPRHRAGFWAHIKEMFMPEEDRATLEESIRRGGYVLTASVDDARADAAVACLEQAGAVDLEERAAQWRTDGWKESGDAEPRTVASADEAASETIPVVEERLRVGKREVNRGGVRVRSYIVEEPVHEEVRLREERVDVQRRPVDEPTRPVARGSNDDLLQERTIEVSETAEQAVIGKEARVKEEVLVRKQAGERVEQVDDTVRRTEVKVEDTRTDPAKRQPRTDSQHPGRT